MDELLQAAQAVVDRWDSPNWKDGTHTADYINRLRRAIAAAATSDGYRTSPDGLTRKKNAPDAAAPLVPSQCVTLRFGADSSSIRPVKKGE